MPMKNPPHPGHSVKDACLDPLGLSITEGAKILGVARHSLSRVVNGHAGISPKWRSGWRRLAGQTQTIGFACRWLTTWRKPACTRATSRSTDTIRNLPCNLWPVNGQHTVRRSGQPKFTPPSSLHSPNNLLYSWFRYPSSGRLKGCCSCPKPFVPFKAVLYW